MKQHILFVTTNKGKVKTLRAKIPKDKFIVSQKSLKLPEVQAKNVELVAKFKAQYAFNILKRPVLVQDSSFHIHALGGFPGPHVKYVNETLGPHGILRLMEGVTQRECHFEHALAYATSKQEIYIFKKNITIGRIAYYVDNNNFSNAWSDLWKIYIPPWSDLPLTSIPKTEFDKHNKEDDSKSEFAKFVNWLNSKYPK